MLNDKDLSFLEKSLEKREPTVMMSVYISELKGLIARVRKADSLILDVLKKASGFYFQKELQDYLDEVGK